MFPASSKRLDPLCLFKMQRVKGSARFSSGYTTNK